MADPVDPERDRLSGRVRRFAQVGTGLAGAGVAYGASRLTGGDSNARNAKLLKEALGNLKGPLMKAAQMFATVPDFLPPEFAAELGELQTNAPSMGRPFVKRRMASELGPDWAARFQSFDLDAAHAASLGQVHRATALDGRPLAVKLQYPEMASAVETDVSQLRALLGLFRRAERAIDPSEALEEIAARLREELDYEREAKHMRLYRAFFDAHPVIAVPEPLADLSTKRLLSMTWLDGTGLLGFKTAPLEVRNRIAAALFEAWWAPMTHIGVIHGDPHLGNYSFTPDGARLNLLDFGCVRVFPPVFVAGVVRLYRALLNDDRAEQYEAYRTWGFANLNDGLVDALNVWARFIYGPLLDDRVRTVADGVEPGAYGRREAFRVRQALKEKGPILIPREFVFMDRAAIGLGAAFLHLGAELNWKSLFDASLEGFSEARLAAHQAKALTAAGLASDHAEWFTQALASEPQTARVDVEGAEIECLAWGERGKPGLLLIHGAGAHAHWWSHIAPILAQDYRVAAFSLSGMGGSDHRKSYSIPLYAEEAFAAAYWAGLFDGDGAPVFAGHSFGGRAVLCAAAGSRGKRLRAALTLDTLISPPDLQIGGRPFGDHVRIYESRDAGVARFRLIPPQPCENQFILDYIAPRSLKPVEGGWSWCFDPKLWERLDEHKTVEDLKGARAPVGLVWGQHSRLMVPVITDYIRANAPKGTPVVIVPEAHHHLMLDQPLALVAGLRGLLAGWPR